MHNGRGPIFLRGVYSGNTGDASLSDTSLGLVASNLHLVDGCSSFWLLSTIWKYTPPIHIGVNVIPMRTNWIRMAQIRAKNFTGSGIIVVPLA